MGIEITTLVEHRCCVRHPVELRVRLRTAVMTEPVPARLVNIGSGGACVELDASCHPGRVVELIDAGTAPWPALVVHREGPVLGLMFDRSRPEDVQALMGRNDAGEAPVAA